MHLARNHADPDFRTRGALGGPHMVALTSEHAHYSYLKAAFLTGTAVALHDQQVTSLQPYSANDGTRRQPAWKFALVHLHAKALQSGSLIRLKDKGLYMRLYAFSHSL